VPTLPDPLDPPFLHRLRISPLQNRRRATRKRIGPGPGEDPLGELFGMRLVRIQPEVVAQFASQIPGKLARLVPSLESTKETEQAVVFT